MQINKFHSDTISRMMEHTQRCQQSNEERERRNEIYRQSCTEGTRELPLASPSFVMLSPQGRSVSDVPDENH